MLDTSSEYKQQFRVYILRAAAVAQQTPAVINQDKFGVRVDCARPGVSLSLSLSVERWRRDRDRFNHLLPFVLLCDALWRAGRRAL